MAAGKSGDWPSPEDIEEARGRKWRPATFASGEAWRPKDRPNYLHKPRVGEDFDGNRFERVPGAWEHEHCCLCWATISGATGEQTQGYVDEEDYEWLCVNCFDKYIAKK